MRKVVIVLLVLLVLASRAHQQNTPMGDLIGVSFFRRTPQLASAFLKRNTQQRGYYGIRKRWQGPRMGFP